MESLGEAKRAMRARIKELRASIGPEERRRLADEIEGRLFALGQLDGTRTIMLFASFGSEVPTQGMLDLQAQGSVYWHLFEPSGQRARVHQATGMVAAQINSDIATALACIRSHAFANERSIYDVADDVIARRLRLSRDP